MHERNESWPLQKREAERVNAERTGFTLETTGTDQIKRAIAKEAREFLKPYIELALAERMKTTAKY